MAKVSDDQDARDLLAAERFDLDELRAAALGQSGAIDRPTAVKLLGRSVYPEAQKREDLERVLLDEEAPSKARHAAAVELGRMGSDAAAGALASAGETPDRFVRAGVLVALDRLGGAAAAAAAAALRASGDTSAADRWHAVLHALAAGDPVDDAQLPQPADTLPLDPAEGREMRFDPADPTVAAAAADQVSGFAGVAVGPEGAVAIECGGRALMLLPAQLTAPAGGPPRPRLAAVVAALTSVEVDAWTVVAFVVSRPAHDEQAQVLVVTTGGDVIMAGVASPDGQLRRFELASAAAPGAVPAEVTGAVHEGTVQFDSGRASTRRTRRMAPSRRD